RSMQPLVPRQPQHIADAIVLAPAHDGVPAEAGVAADHDPRLRPPRPDLRDDPLELLDAAGRTILVRWPQPGAQQMLAAEDVQRQIAVTPVVAMEEPPFLVTMQWIIGRIQIQPDLPRWLLVGLEEHVYQQPIERVRI